MTKKREVKTIFHKNEAYSHLKPAIIKEVWDQDGTWYNVVYEKDSSVVLAAFRSRKNAERCCRLIKEARDISLEGTELT